MITLKLSVIAESNSIHKMHISDFDIRDLAPSTGLARVKAPILCGNSGVAV